MKMKTVLCLSIFILLLAMTGCGKEETKAVSDNTAQMTENQDADNSILEEEPGQDDIPDDSKAEESSDKQMVMPDTEQQYQCILDNKEVWLQQEIPDEMFFYAVTDMDENGYLEIIRTTCQGSGYYSLSDIWMVNADASGLETIEIPWSEGDSQPDLIYGIRGYYYKDDEYYYTLDDVLYVGLDSYYTKYALQLKGKELLAEEISNYTVTAIDTGSEKEVGSYDFHFYQTDGSEVEEEDYYELEQERFKEYDSGYCCFCFLEIIPEMEEAEIESILEDSYHTYRMSKELDEEGNYCDYEFHIYTEDAEEYEALSQPESLGNLKDGDTDIRFVCNMPDVTVTLQEVEWLSDAYCFIPVSDLFTKELKKDQVYEFSGTLAESIPRYRLKLDYYGNSTYWYLQYDGSGEAYGHFVVTPDYSEKTWPVEDDPITDLLKAYAVMLLQAGDSVTLQNDYFWETIAAAAWMHGYCYDLLEEDGSIEVNGYMMDSYRKVLFPYAYDYEMPGENQPVIYNEAANTYQVFDDKYLEPYSVEILYMEETESGMLGIDFVIHGQQDEGVYMLLLRDYDDANAFGFLVLDAYVSVG